ncbi:hypothetical protein AF72_03780 [Xylella taiwanensis]|uniref:Uncharacterized protein n=1 Tax=Xylella taiwanensis TaxID=1444770 RepID=Z9JJV3_9GAMM|nr:hypothetical protein AB672_03430 [Xylella taiwanensis]EWS78695.1 hypothetical protein AF72_03780 [Xylella taiwanensis]
MIDGDPSSSAQHWHASENVIECVFNRITSVDRISTHDNDNKRTNHDLVFALLPDAFGAYVKM